MERSDVKRSDVCVTHLNSCEILATFQQKVTLTWRTPEKVKNASSSLVGHGALFLLRCTVFCVSFWMSAVQCFVCEREKRFHDACTRTAMQDWRV